MPLPQILWTSSLPTWRSWQRWLLRPSFTLKSAMCLCTAAAKEPFVYVTCVSKPSVTNMLNVSLAIIFSSALCLLCDSEWPDAQPRWCDSCSIPSLTMHKVVVHCHSQISISFFTNSSLLRAEPLPVSHLPVQTYVAVSVECSQLAQLKILDIKLSMGHITPHICVKVSPLDLIFNLFVVYTLQHSELVQRWLNKRSASQSIEKQHGEKCCHLGLPLVQNESLWSR